MKSNLNLISNPNLSHFQNYVRKMEIEREFEHQTVLQKCLMLGEEVGELFKAIRKKEDIKVDLNSKIGSVEEELADIFIYLCAIANRYDIDLEKAFRDKEEINEQRVWKRSKN